LELFYSLSQQSEFLSIENDFLSTQLNSSQPTDASKKILRTILWGGMIIGAGSLMGGCKGVTRNDLRIRQTS